MGVLQWTPHGFWNATVYDVERALDGWSRANGLDTATANITPDDRKRLDALMASMPDG